MASKLMTLSLLLSLFFISQVTSDFRPIKEKASHVSQALNVFKRAGSKLQLIHNIDLSKYLNYDATSRGLTLAVTPAPSPSAQLDCGGLCKNRCSLNSRPNSCLRACGTCCSRCKCVPPGTSGNREFCGKCYTGMTTHNNRTKCP